MCQYVEHVADQVLEDLGVPAIYGSSNPFDWMEILRLEGRKNFFENPAVSEYQHAGILDPDYHIFSLDADF